MSLWPQPVSSLTVTGVGAPAIMFPVGQGQGRAGLGAPLQSVFWPEILFPALWWKL